MTDAAAFPGVIHAQTAIINPGQVRPGSVGRRLPFRDWVLHRVAELSHLLRITGRPESWTRTVSWGPLSRSPWRWRTRFGNN